MKKHIATIALFSIVAAALVAVPTVSRAQDAAAPAAAAPAAKKHGGLPFHGKVTAVDTTASTITIKDLTINVTSDTKITKDGQPVTLADITVGAAVGGSYKKDDAGKLTATVIHVGAKKAKKAQN